MQVLMRMATPRWVKVTDEAKLERDVYIPRYFYGCLDNPSKSIFCTK